MSRETVAFAQMKDATQADYDLLSRRLQPYLEESAERVLETLQHQMTERESGHQIHRLDHALQCATRARADGADIDWIAAALLHDIGHLLHGLPEDLAEQGIDGHHEQIGEKWLKKWLLTT